MSLIDNARARIEIRDEQLVRLFEERLECVKDVLAYKIENNLQVYDQNREKSLINKNLSYFKDKENEEYFKIFMDGILSSSKAFQKDHYE